MSLGLVTYCSILTRIYSLLTIVIDLLHNLLVRNNIIDTYSLYQINYTRATVIGDENIPVSV